MREINEDACLYREDASAALAVVADGTGGRSSGRVAADIAVEACASAFDRRFVAYSEAWWLGEHAAPDGEPTIAAWSSLATEERVRIEAHVRDVIATRTASTLGDLTVVAREGDVLAAVAREALLHANQAILARSASEAALKGMGTTAVVGIFARGGRGSASGVAALAHVGDSRIYRVRSGVLQQLTSDHTLLDHLLKLGELTPEESEAFPHKNVIIRAIGTNDSLEVDTQVVETRPGDVFLLCSDGVPNTWTDALILRAITGHGVDAAIQLVEDGARSRTNEDNLTAVMVEIVS